MTKPLPATATAGTAAMVMMVSVAAARVVPAEQPAGDRDEHDDEDNQFHVWSFQEMHK